MLGWHLLGLSQVPTWTPPPFITCWTVPAFLCFSTFCTSSVFFFFLFLCFLVFFVPSYFIRTARRQQLIGIFSKYVADTQPCDGPPSTLYHFYCRYRCDWRDQKLQSLRCHFNHMFHAFKRTRSCCQCFLHPSTSTKHYVVQHTQSVYVPIRHSSDKESSV